MVYSRRPRDPQPTILSKPRINLEKETTRDAEALNMMEDKGRNE